MEPNSIESLLTEPPRLEPHGGPVFIDQPAPPDDLPFVGVQLRRYAWFARRRRERDASRAIEIGLGLVHDLGTRRVVRLAFREIEICIEHIRLSESAAGSDGVAEVFARELGQVLQPLTLLDEPVLNYSLKDLDTIAVAAVSSRALDCLWHELDEYLGFLPGWFAGNNKVDR